MRYVVNWCRRGNVRELRVPVDLHGASWSVSMVGTIEVLLLNLEVWATRSDFLNMVDWRDNVYYLAKKHK